MYAFPTNSGPQMACQTETSRLQAPQHLAEWSRAWSAPAWLTAHLRSCLAPALQGFFSSCWLLEAAVCPSPGHHQGAARRTLVKPWQCLMVRRKELAGCICNISPSLPTPVLCLSHPPAVLCLIRAWAPLGWDLPFLTARHKAHLSHLINNISVHGETWHEDVKR